MASNPDNWTELYRSNKDDATSLDIETQGVLGPITIVGLSRVQDGSINYTGLIAHKTLTLENCAKALRGCGLLITYNGLRHDIPRLRAEFPELLLDRLPVLDLYHVAKSLGMKANLQTLETTFGIQRPDPRTQKRRIATKLWRRYQTTRNPETLNLLIAYNRQDTINLHPLAHALAKRCANQRV